MTYQPRAKLPTEFALAVACCRSGFSDEGQAKLKEIAQEVDWSAFVATVRRHRVQGLAYAALRKAGIHPPAPLEMVLADDAKVVAQQGLRLAGVSVEIKNAFGEAGLPLLFLKGLAVGKLAYGNPFLKMGWDIDLLVMPSDIGAAAEILRALGFRLLVPGQSERLLRWHAARKESVWQRQDGVIVDLHSRVADQPQLLAGLNALSPSQDVQIAPGVVLPTFATDELIAYLCVHGASSAWFRLKWLSDLAALLDRTGPEATDALYERLQELAAGRAAAQAFLVSNWLFGTYLPAAIPGDRISLWLARTAIKEMLRGEPTERPLGTRNIHLTQFSLLPGIRFKLAEFRRQIQDAAGID